MWLIGLFQHLGNSHPGDEHGILWLVLAAQRCARSGDRLLVSLFALYAARHVDIVILVHAGQRLVSIATKSDSRVVYDMLYGYASPTYTATNVTVSHKVS